MVAFRKSFPVLAVFALMGAASAFAQTNAGNSLQCTANAGVPPAVRAEGYTELTGDLVVTCTGGDPAQPFNANFQLFLNTNITSRLLADGTSEALLMIDEPGLARTAVGGGAGTPTPFCVSPGPSSNNTMGVACNPATAGVTNQVGTYTVFKGARQIGSPENIVVWQGIPVVPPGSNTRTFRITNVRANAAGLGSSQTLIPTQIVAYISVSPSGTLPIDNPQQTVGFVQQGLIFDTRNCGDTGGPGSGGSTAFQCRSVNESRFNDASGGGLPSNGGSVDTIFGLRFREAFQTAFKPRIMPGQEESIPNVVYNSESGFVHTGLAGVGTADTGTRLAARFVNIPANVRLFVSTTQVTGPSSTSAAANLVSTDPSGAGGGTFPPSGTVTLNCSSSITSAASEVSIVNGTGVAVWEVTAADQSNNESFFFQVGYAYKANASLGQPALGQAQVIGNLAPFYTTANAGTAGSGLNIPRFTGRTEASNLFKINSCQTNLLFPYVTNQAGFDTGIAISNTSQDPFSAANANNGTCSINYYGILANGNPPTTLKETTDRDVNDGDTLTFILSGGGSFGLKGNPNFQGYIIAQCNFLYAHGFAFVTDGPIGQAKVAEGYLALVLDGADAGNLRGSSFGEVRGH